MPKWVIRKKLEVSYSKNGNNWQYLSEGKRRKWSWHNSRTHPEIHLFNSSEEAQQELDFIKTYQPRKCNYEIIPKEEG